MTRSQAAGRSPSRHGRSPGRWGQPSKADGRRSPVQGSGRNGAPRKDRERGHGSATADGAVVPVDEVCADQSTTHRAPVPADGACANQLPLGAPVYTGGSTAGPRYSRPSEYTDSRDSRPHGAATGFWDVLNPTEREVLRSLASWRTFAAGARIMEEGERADHVMVILGGEVEIRLHVDGTERVVAVRGRGQLVGERAALKVSVRSATVVALEMVWALVVETKDFAAFISAHPRVLDIVQNQQYQRRAAGAPGYEYDDSADDVRAGWVNGDQPEENHSAGYSGKRPKALTGENCTVVLTDVADYGARIRTDNDRLLIREALFRMTQRAMQGFPGAQSENRGDSS